MQKLLEHLILMQLPWYIRIQKQLYMRTITTRYMEQTQGSGVVSRTCAITLLVLNIFVTETRPDSIASIVDFPQKVWKCQQYILLMLLRLQHNI